MPSLKKLYMLPVVFALLTYAEGGFSAEKDAGFTDLADYAASEKWTGDFDGMVKRNEIRVLVVPSKTLFFIDQGHKRGATYEAMMEFEKFVNARVGKKTVPVRIIFLPVKREELLKKLASGYGDIAAANLTITPERLKLVDFTDPVLSGVEELVVTCGKEKDITGYDPLAGREVYARKSSSYYPHLEAINRVFVKTGRAPIKIIEAEDLLEDEDLLEMVNADLLPMIIMDSHKANFWATIFDNIKVHPKAVISYDGDIAWAIRKKSPQLKKISNDFLAGHKKGTLIGNVIYNRYFREGKYVKNSLSEKEIKKFQSMVALFKKYGDRYNFNYLMLGAQAYQESGLDNSKKSPAGAVGVMQLLPSTAKDPNVAIPDIHNLEQNIHAGAKYLRFLVDRYYSDPAISGFDRMLFSFAAYNAGPAKVEKMRQVTRQMGLDANVWFRNTEIGAGRVVGRETVQYVANIYKYYIAYRILSQGREEKERLEGASVIKGASVSD